MSLRIPVVTILMLFMTAPYIINFLTRFVSAQIRSYNMQFQFNKDMQNYA